MLCCGCQRHCTPQPAAGQTSLATIFVATVVAVSRPEIFSSRTVAARRPGTLHDCASGWRRRSGMGRCREESPPPCVNPRGACAAPKTERPPTRTALTQFATRPRRLSSGSRQHSLGFMEASEETTARIAVGIAESFALLPNELAPSRYVSNDLLAHL